MVTHDSPRDHHRPIVDAITSALDASVVSADQEWSRVGSIAVDRRADVVLLFVRFRFLAAQSSTHWGSFDGLRAVYDLDTNQDFAAVIQSSYGGRWVPEMRRHGIGTLLATSRMATERFSSTGFDTEWIPKGFDPLTFVDLERERSGYCTFGRDYPARAAMCNYLERQNYPFAKIERCSYKELNARLNEHLACLVCNMQARPRFGKIGQVLQKRFPAAVSELLPAPELMIKNYEAAGAGCAVVSDRCDELWDLGFQEGQTVLTYGSFEELLDMMDSVTERELRDIGRRSHDFVHQHHTWACRAEQMANALRRRLR